MLEKDLFIRSCHKSCTEKLWRRCFISVDKMALMLWVWRQYKPMVHHAQWSSKFVIGKLVQFSFPRVFQNSKWPSFQILIWLHLACNNFTCFKYCFYNELQNNDTKSLCCPLHFSLPLVCLACNNSKPFLASHLLRSCVDHLSTCFALVNLKPDEVLGCT